MAEILGVDHSTLWRAMRAANDATAEPLTKRFAQKPDALMGGQNGQAKVKHIPALEHAAFQTAD